MMSLFCLGTMSRIWGLCTIASLSILLLTLCPTGLALNCLECPWFSNAECGNKTTCPASNDVCIRISTASGSYYNCWDFTKCDSQGLAEYFKLTRFNYTCCSSNLCNSGRTSLPVISVVLSLVAVVFMICR
ncbi:CD59 glycoprotein-like [Pelobates fuscus]|uniref:CD59 glycoprotein-like n=1 Tax=Pelobates fuscus TaxID=191477 RepID=UPI002FE44C59